MYIFDFCAAFNLSASSCLRHKQHTSCLLNTSAGQTRTMTRRLSGQKGKADPASNACCSPFSARQ